jgi:hypothetical protein
MILTTILIVGVSGTIGYFLSEQLWIAKATFGKSKEKEDSFACKESMDEVNNALDPYRSLSKPEISYSGDFPDGNPIPKQPKKPPLIIGYRNPHKLQPCPRCGLEWYYTKGPNYCECGECDTGHFHMECSLDTGQGCKAKFITRAKEIKE